MKRKSRQQLSGAQKLKAAGRKAILLGVLPEVLDTLRAAAAIEMRPVSQFVVYHALQAAETVTARAPQAVRYERYGTAAQADPNRQPATQSRKRRK